MALSPKLLHVLSKVGCDAFSQGFPAIHISQDFLVSAKGFLPLFRFQLEGQGGFRVDLSAPGEQVHSLHSSLNEHDNIETCAGVLSPR